MLIQNLTRILKGELLNHPSISQIYGFAFEPKQVKQGFAYIADNSSEKQIEQALKNRAYAVISSDKLPIVDPEIAYIKVNDLHSSLFRLMRYEAGQKGVNFFYTSPIQMAILSRLSLGKNATLMSENINELFERILRANPNEYFFSANTCILEHISPFYDQIFSDTKAVSLNHSSIFFSSVICDDIFYQNLSIPRVFLPNFCGILKFLKKNRINFKVNEMKNLGHFEPIFIDKNFNPTNFGSSFRAIIAENDEELFCAEMAFLSKEFNEGEVIFCMPKGSECKTSNAIYFENLSELKSLKNFRYALVLAHKAEILAMLNEQKDQLGLFDF